uniref:Uncharacterized protein n=1 Tax=Timema bartmani TaxID=61472 RepID=A0A7R9EPZ7_9NEOP|nr:unnamed protein product [Timema bartmani]
MKLPSCFGTPVPLLKNAPVYESRGPRFDSRLVSRLREERGLGGERGGLRWSSRRIEGRGGADPPLLGAVTTVGPSAARGHLLGSPSTRPQPLPLSLGVHTQTKQIGVLLDAWSEAEWSGRAINISKTRFVKEGFGTQVNLCRDRGLNPRPPAQKSDTLPLDHQVTDKVVH